MADYGRISYTGRHDLVSGPATSVGRVAYTARQDLVSGPDSVGRVAYIARHDLTSGSTLFIPTTQAKGRTSPSAEVPAGSRITVQGQDLTSTHGTPASGSNDFKGNAGSKNAVVASMVAAINDGGNNFGSIVSGQTLPTDPEILELIASAATFPGTGGNAITLTTNDAPNLAVTSFAGGAEGLQESVFISEAISGTYIPSGGSIEVFQGDLLQGGLSQGDLFQGDLLQGEWSFTGED